MTEHLTPYSDEEIEEREFRLEYGILQLDFWRELNDWRQKALEAEPEPARPVH